MHFALPPRKTSQPPPFARAANLHNAAQRRRQMQGMGSIVLVLATLYLLYKALFTGGTAPEPTEIEANPSVVMVTVFDESRQSKEFIDIVKENREDYARRWGHVNFFTNVSTYESIIAPSPTSWSMVPALRHTLTLYPRSTYVWYLSAYSLITNPALGLSDHIFNNLTTLMQRDVPVVPPDSVIRTFSHLKPVNVHLILSQDMDNLAHSSLILRNAPSPAAAAASSPNSWPLFLLDAWLDPLYRTYAFQKAEQHALEHIVQWHPTVLAKLALIPQRMLNSYNFKYGDQEDPENPGQKRHHDSMWQQGDFVVSLKGCEAGAGGGGDAGEGKEKGRDCMKEMRQYAEIWRNEVKSLDGVGSGNE
ncbi:putative alpha-1,2-galactosyltransferase [Cyphellophora attinorum]|uniref:Putative alpha-1,2-galactosyltransferase n=1 Tax=Cyphellophora attinorum TaxID=1664694 RepID=A0A0N1HDU8_9EURO|nr:putative alpha-1,2-galactosyltransferase [Phialophora attinorum]KPI43334.1 putative alpha-1,2-galactosyltransferase [Phialophora attinorum]